MPGKDWTPEELFQVNAQTWTACAIQAAVKLDLFTALDSSETPGLTEAELARKLGLNPRALGMLATAMTSLGFLDRDGDRLSLTNTSHRYLSAKSDDYYGFAILHSAHILPAWTRLADSVKSGTHSSDRCTQNTGEDEAQREAFLMGMFNIARRQADRVAAAFDLTGRRRLLDLGGGPGTYALYFCRHYPELTATVFDQPTTEKFARSVAKKYELTDRVDFVGGDFLSDDIPQGFDVAWLSQILHGENPADAARLVARGAVALNPGGILAVQEFIIDDDRKGPVQPSLFALNMLVQTDGGQAYTEGEIRSMLADAGLTNIRRLQADLPPGCGIVVGDK